MPDDKVGERLRPGGLMRCCTATLAEHIEVGGPVAVGDILPCKHCSSSMRIAADGVWEWNHD
jgi:hypothetical protein